MSAPDIFPLPFADAGKPLILMDIRADEALRRRLGELGLTLKMPLRVIQYGEGGALILAVKDDSRIALGRGMAQRILVTYEPAEG